MKTKIFSLVLILASAVFLIFSCESKDLLEDKTNMQTSVSQKFQKVQSTDPIKRQFQLDMEHYINSYNDSNWDEVITTSYPPLFGGKKKEDVLIDFIKSNQYGIKYNIDLNKIEKVSDIIEDDKNRYAKIHYSADVTVTLNGEALKNKDYIVSNLELSHDTPDLVLDETTNTVSIDAYSSMIAVSKKGSNIWKYIMVDKQKEQHYSAIVPQTILDQLD